MPINNINTIALVGFGRIAEVLYAPYLKKHFTKTLLVCEPNPTRHRVIQEILPNSIIVNDLEKLKNDPKKLSFAFNLVSGPNHELLSYRLLEKGWNVFTEKPAAKSSVGWNKIVIRAKMKNLIIVSAPVTPYMPNVQKLKKFIDSGNIGEISEIHLNFFSGGPARRGYIDDSRKWFFGKESCVIRDLAPYLISTILHLLGKPSNFIWKRNNLKPLIDVRPEGFIKPVYGNAAIGIGNLEKALLTVSVAYRAKVNNVNAKLFIASTSGNFECDLDEQPNNGLHSEIKTSLVFDLIGNSIKNENFWTQHVNEVKETLAIIELAFLQG